MMEKQGLERWELAARASMMQCGRPYAVCRVDVGTACKEELDNIYLSLACCSMQGSLVLLGPLLDLCPSIQQLDHGRGFIVVSS